MYLLQSIFKYYIHKVLTQLLTKYRHLLAQRIHRMLSDHRAVETTMQFKYITFVTRFPNVKYNVWDIQVRDGNYI